MHLFRPTAPACALPGEVIERRISSIAQASSDCRPVLLGRSAKQHLDDLLLRVAISEFNSGLGHPLDRFIVRLLRLSIERVWL